MYFSTNADYFSYIGLGAAGLKLFHGNVVPMNIRGLVRRVVDGNFQPNEGSRLPLWEDLLGFKYTVGPSLN